MQIRNKFPDKKNRRAFNVLKKLVKHANKTPLVIGITGAGGAGKTTFANNILHTFGKSLSLAIDLDDYLISRSERAKLELTGYNPRANNLYKAKEDIDDLVEGKTILKPRYDHSTGTILPKEKISSREIIVIEGVTTLYEELRNSIDITFFLDALKETQIKSRIKRDVEERGYALDEALQLYDNLQPDYKRFIEPTKKYATVVFQVDTNYIMHPIKIKKDYKYLFQ